MIVKVGKQKQNNNFGKPRYLQKRWPF